MENRIQKAIAFARAAHRGQERKYTKEPYINHPLEVANILLHGSPHDVVTDDMMIAALLHDVVEDTPTQLWEIGATFGPLVEKLVDELTEPKHEGNRFQRKRAEAERLGTISAEAQTIKCADIIANLRDIEQYDPKFAPKYKLEKQWALSSMDKAYGPLRQAAWLAAVPVKGD